MKMRIYSLTLLAAILLIALIACGKGGPAESGLSKGETGKVSASHRPGHGGSGGGGGGDDGGGGGGGGGTPGPGDWNQYGHDSRHSGRSAFAGPDSPMLKFAYQPSKDRFGFHGATFGSDGTAYIGHLDGNVYAVNPNGTLKWKFKTNGWVVSAPAIGNDGTIYAGSNDGNFYAINASGTLKWVYSVGGNFTASAAIADDGTIYFGQGNLFALNPNGSLKWIFDGGGFSTTPAIGSDGTIYIGRTIRFTNNNGQSYFERYFYAIYPDSSLKWQILVDEQITNSTVFKSPSIAEDNTAYFPIGSVLFALNSDGTINWHLECDRRVQSSPAIDANGDLYFGVGEGELNEFYALHPSGSVKWVYTFEPFRAATSPAAIDSAGTIYVGTENRFFNQQGVYDDTDGKLFAFDADGSIRWAFLPNGSRPGGKKGGNVGGISIAQDGSVVFPCSDWRLYALGPGAG